MNLKIACFLIFLPTYSIAQKHNTPEIIRRLLSCKREIPVISGWCKNLLPQEELPNELQKEYQYLVKTKESLYCGVNGTGRLYKITDSNGSIVFHRIDSTYYSGSDFFAAPFTIDNTIYSYGGYGFWKTNGLLRSYNVFSKEWDIQKSDKEIPCNFHTGSGFWVDTQYKRLYIVNPVIRNEGLKSDTSFSSINGRINLSDRSIYVLDLTTGIWKDLSSSFHLPPGLTQSPWGMWNVGNFNFTYLFDFRNNKLYQSSKEFQEKASKIFNNIEKNIWFFIDSTLYVGNLNLNIIDSLPVSINDFEDTGKAIYNESFLSGKTSNLYNRWFIIVSVGVITLSFILFKRKKIKFKLTEFSNSNLINSQNSNSTNGHLFSAIELELIRYAFEKNKQKSTVSAAEINKILGLSGKSESVQKKNRSDTITTINQKWAAAHGNRITLIHRKRSFDDKRSFEYFIHADWMEMIKVLV